jgi:hypothetical protein
MEPFRRLDTVVSYFIGNDPSKWHPDVPVRGGVRYVDHYPGVDLEVTGQQVRRDWRRDKDVLVVPLAKPVLGAATVLVTFEQPMSARGGELPLGRVTPLGVQSERGYIQVVSPLQVNCDVVRSTGPLLGSIRWNCPPNTGFSPRTRPSGRGNTPRGPSISR